MSHFHCQFKGPFKGLFSAASCQDSRCHYVLVHPVCNLSFEDNLAVPEMLNLRAPPPALGLSRIPVAAHHNSRGCLDEGTGTFPEDRISIG